MISLEKVSRTLPAYCIVRVHPERVDILAPYLDEETASEAHRKMILRMPQEQAENIKLVKTKITLPKNLFE